MADRYGNLWIMLLDFFFKKKNEFSLSQSCSFQSSGTLSIFAISFFLFFLPPLILISTNHKRKGRFKIYLNLRSSCQVTKTQDIHREATLKYYPTLHVYSWYCPFSLLYMSCSILVCFKETWFLLAYNNEIRRVPIPSAKEAERGNLVN